MNKGFQKKAYTRAIMERQKNEIDFTLAENPGILEVLIVRNNFRSSDHRMASCRVGLTQEKGKSHK